MQKRYGTRLYTPGDKIPGKTIKQDDQEIRSDYNHLQDRRRELLKRLSVVTGEIEQIKINLGAWVAEGCDHKEHTDRLAELRAEMEGLQAGADYLAGQIDLMKRVNAWL